MATYEVDTDIINARMQDASQVLNDVLNSQNMFDNLSKNFSPTFMQSWVNKNYKFSEFAEDAGAIAGNLKEYIEWMQTTLQEVIDGDIGRGEQYEGDEGFGSQGGVTGGGGTPSTIDPQSVDYLQYSSLPATQAVYGPGITTTPSTSGTTFTSGYPSAVYGPSTYYPSSTSSLYGSGSSLYGSGSSLYGSGSSLYGSGSSLYGSGSSLYGSGSSLYGSGSSLYGSGSSLYGSGSSLYGSAGTSSLYGTGGSGGYTGSGGSSLVNGPYGSYDPNNLYDPNNPNSPYYKGNASGTNGSGKSKESGLSSTLGKGLSGLSNMRDALSRTNGKLAGNLSPTSTGLGIGGLSPISMAGLGLAAGGAIAGAGLLLGKKRNYEFTPEDWEALDEDTQKSILAAMQAVGFEQEDVDSFVTSTFSVPKTVIDPHRDNIKDVMEVDEALSRELFDIYGFNCIDEEGNIDIYILFIMLSLDGVKFDDNYNMYNILNEHLEDAKIDFTYSGINMFEYVKDQDDLEEDIEDEETEYDSVNLEETEA